MNISAKLRLIEIASKLRDYLAVTHKEHCRNAADLEVGPSGICVAHHRVVSLLLREELVEGRLLLVDANGQDFEAFALEFLAYLIDLRLHR